MSATAKNVAAGVAAVGLAGLALLGLGALVGSSGVRGVGDTLLGIGLLSGLVAVGVAVVREMGNEERVAPLRVRQTSCCGCSCAVALLVLPAAGALLWSHGGPGAAVLALPAWVPLVRVAELAYAMGVAALAVARRSAARMRSRSPRSSLVSARGGRAT
jgi:hypothetical protein